MNVFSIFTKAEPISRSAPELNTEDQLATALIEFRRADRAYKDATQRLASYTRLHRDQRAFSINGRMFVNVTPKPDPARMALEHAASQSRIKRNECLRIWSELKVKSARG